MKTKAITIFSGIRIKELEEAIDKKDRALKELARSNGKHLAMRNLPAAIGDRLHPYLGELKSGYEELAAYIQQHMQPATHIPQAQMENAAAKEKDKQLDLEIKKKEDQAANDRHSLGNYHPGSIALQILIVAILTFIIWIGDTVYLTKSFAITGENFLFSLVLSISVSVAAFGFSHLASFLLKSAKSPFWWRVILFSSLGLILAVFITLAIFRSRYLAAHDIEVSPVSFVIINFFFFIVSALLSFFILPSWQEIRDNIASLKKYNGIKKNLKKAENLRNEKEERKKILADRNSQRIELNHHAQYSVDLVRKKYAESVEIFKGTNIVYRTDRQVPDCFEELPPSLDISDPIVFYSPDNSKEK